jgi:hypothetical protein
MRGQKQSLMDAKKKALLEIQQGWADCFRPHLVIPRWVAPQHCPTSFHQAGEILSDKRCLRVTEESSAGTGETKCRAAQIMGRDRYCRWASSRGTYPSRRLIRPNLILPAACGLVA